MGTQKKRKSSAKKISKFAFLKKALLGSGKKKKSAASAKKASSRGPAKRAPKAAKKPERKLKKLEARKVEKKAEKKLEKKAEKPGKLPALKGKVAAPVVPVKPAKAGKGGKSTMVAFTPAPTGKGATAGAGKRGHASAAGIPEEAVCREVACEGLATTGGYCRMHYIKNWKKIKRKELILREGKLNQYIEELVAKYPDKYIEAIRQDLASDKDFSKVIHDLDLDESIDDFDVDGEAVEGLIDSIKRDFDDEGEGF
jgi:hypothetical protein